MVCRHVSVQLVMDTFSKGLYKGIAHDANVALLKVCGEYGFTTEAIVQAIEWCIRKKRGITLRVINIS